MKISEQSKSVHPIVISGMQLIFDRYSESDMTWEEYHFLHRVLSQVHEKTLAMAEKDKDIG